MRALVTGGAGFLGSHLVERLLSQGDEVSVLDNLRRGRIANIEPHATEGRVRLVRGDVREYERVLEATRGVDAVFHLAAQPNVMGSLRNLDYCFTTNVLGTFNVLTAAAAAGARRVVFTSSREVYGEPVDVPVAEDSALTAKNAYGASKVAAEALCRAWQERGLEVAVLRLTNVYGPRDRGRVIPLWLERAFRGQDLELFGGKQVVDFLWVGTAVEALAAASRGDVNGPVNVGSGRGVTLVELAARILEMTESDSRVALKPARGVEVVRFVADVTKMRSVLGVEPPEDPLDNLTLWPQEGRRGSVASARPGGKAAW